MIVTPPVAYTGTAGKTGESVLNIPPHAAT